MAKITIDTEDNSWLVATADDSGNVKIGVNVRGPSQLVNLVHGALNAAIAAAEANNHDEMVASLKKQRDEWMATWDITNIYDKTTVEDGNEGFDARIDYENIPKAFMFHTDENDN